MALAESTVPRATNGTHPVPSSSLEVADIPLDQIVLASNVRTTVGDVDELASSIQQHGVLEPVKVVRLADGTYRLRFGHRRYAAAKQIGLPTIPAIIGEGPDPDDVRVLEQLVENIQRRDLNPLEEARALRALLDAEPGLTHDALAARVSRSRPTVTNLLRILDLEPKVQVEVAAGKLSAAHAKALAGYNGKGQIEMAKQAIEYGYSAHELERIIQQERQAAERQAKEAKKLEKWAAGAEAQLIEQGADKKTSKITSVDGYSYSGQAEIAALKARGWKSATPSFSRGKECDCSAWGVDRTWDGKTRIVRRCVVEAHYRAKQQREGKSTTDNWQAQVARQRERDELASRVRNRYMAAVVGQAEARPLPRMLLEALAWLLIDAFLNDWARDRAAAKVAPELREKEKRKRPDPWARIQELTDDELLTLVLEKVGKGFRDRFNVKVPWETIESQLIGQQPTAELSAKPKRGAKAVAS